MNSKKVLLTRAGGLAESLLPGRLAELGYNVRAFVHHNSFNYWSWSKCSSHINDIEVYSGEVRNSDSARNEMKNCAGAFPYSVSKSSAHKLAIDYWRPFQLLINLVLPFNTLNSYQSSWALDSIVVSQSMQ
jgi:dTDP-D-glucose 4,6-dehydratase